MSLLVGQWVLECGLSKSVSTVRISLAALPPVIGHCAWYKAYHPYRKVDLWIWNTCHSHISLGGLSRLYSMNSGAGDQTRRLHYVMWISGRDALEISSMSYRLQAKSSEWSEGHPFSRGWGWFKRRCAWTQYVDPGPAVCAITYRKKYQPTRGLAIRSPNFSFYHSMAMSQAVVSLRYRYTILLRFLIFLFVYQCTALPAGLETSIDHAVWPRQRQTTQEFPGYVLEEAVLGTRP